MVSSSNNALQLFALATLGCKSVLNGKAHSKFLNRDNTIYLRDCVKTILQAREREFGGVVAMAFLQEARQRI